MESVREVQSVTTFDLAEYFPASVPYRRAYLRRDLRLTDGAAMPYARYVCRSTRRSGSFVDRETDNLTRYMARSEAKEPELYLDWPSPGEGRRLGLFVEFDPPLPYLPATIRADAMVESLSDVRVFDRWGHPLRSGTVRHTVWVDGYESTVADGVRFEACLRLEIDTRIRLRWGPWVDAKQYLWLASGIGEVRRVERIQVLGFLSYFDETYAYELASGQNVKCSTGGCQPSPSWARVAILFDRLLFRLRIGGMLVEHAHDE